MTEEKILKRSDGTYVLAAFKSVGIEYACESADHRHGDNVFPIHAPPARTEPSVWNMFKAAKPPTSTPPAVPESKPEG